MTQRSLEVRDSIQKEWGWCWATKSRQDSPREMDAGRSHHQEPHSNKCVSHLQTFDRVRLQSPL